MNTLKTFMLMAALTALFLVGGQLLAGQQGMIIALVMALGLNFFAYWNSDNMALAMNKARAVSPEEEPELHRFRRVIEVTTERIDQLLNAGEG